MRLLSRRPDVPQVERPLAKSSVPGAASSPVSSTPWAHALRHLHSPASPLLLLAAATLLPAGCYSPMYTQPYGYPTYPGTIQPGAPYYPGAVTPGATLGAPTFEGGASPSPGGGNAPFYGSGSNTGNRPVPDYPGGTSDPYYQNPGASTGGASGGAAWSIDAESGGFDAASEQFHPPVTNARDISLSREVKAISELPYAHDTSDHRWLQGVVSLDPRDKSWGIVYSFDPEPTDPYAGYLTLADDPRLKALKDGDVVRLEGEIDASQRDSLNRPMYVVRTITPMSR